MNRFRIINQYLMTALVLAALAACSGGGSSSSSSGGNGGNGGGNADTFFTATFLQPLGSSTFSVAVALNGANEAVGLSDGGATEPTTMKAVAWTVTTAGDATTSAVSPLAMPPGAGAYSAAYGNNNGGSIVGEVESAPGGAIVPAFWPGRTATPAQVVLLQRGTATRGSAHGINTAGRIVGELLTAGVPAAATWAGSTAPPATLPATGLIASSAYFINDNGEIVGEATDTTGGHAALWRPNAAGAYATGPTLLPGTATLNGSSIALAINAAGAVAGEVKDSTGIVHAVQWTRDAAGTYKLVDLGASGAAAGINDKGRVVGHAIVTKSKASAWAAGTDIPLTPDDRDDILEGSELDDDDDALESQAYAINTDNRVVGIKGVQAFIAAPK